MHLYIIESLLHHEDDTSSRNNVPDDDLADQVWAVCVRFFVLVLFVWHVRVGFGV